MHKKFLALMLCSVFAVWTAEALCCFSKRAVERDPGIVQAHPDADDEMNLEQALGKAGRARLAQQQLDEYKNRLNLMNDDIPEESLRTRQACIQDIEDWQKAAAHHVRALKNDENYKKFCKGFCPHVSSPLSASYSEDKQDQEKVLRAYTPLPDPLVFLVTGYLWKKGKDYTAVSDCNDVSYGLIRDNNRKIHIFITASSRNIFWNASSVNFVSDDWVTSLFGLAHSETIEGFRIDRKEPEGEKQNRMNLLAARRNALLVLPVLD